MLAKRIIACLDVRDGHVVKGVNFVGLQNVGDPATLVYIYAQAGIDEVVVLDVTATVESRTALVATIDRVARAVFVPLTVGGGISSVDDAARLVDAGADKISVNSAALRDPSLITRLADRFGRQAVVVAIDARRSGHSYYDVLSRGGTVVERSDAVSWAQEAEARGAGEILLTSMDRDGTKSGFDCVLTAGVSESVGVPVIASGGGGTPEDFAEVLTMGRADAALAASVFHRGVTSVGALKRYLADRGLPVRLGKRGLVLIPSIDLLGGQVVQLEQGERLRYASRDIDAWVERFSSFPIVQLIDLDAARGTGDNRDLVLDIARRLPCQVGGGIRTPAVASALIDAGAQRVIIGSALFTPTAVNADQASAFSRAVGAPRLVAAVDARGPSVVVGGWRTTLPIGPVEAMNALEESVGAFLYTDVSREGLLGGFDLAAVEPIRRATARQLIVAGGIRSVHEVDDLHAMGIDAVVGMAIYTESFPYRPTIVFG